jgi:broad specificity phosphatase PhoE
MNNHAVRRSRPADEHDRSAATKAAARLNTGRLARCIVACAGALLAATVLADEAQLDTLLPSLQQGGYVIVLRHGATDPRQEDVYPLNYEDMSRQRQLSEEGRQVARQTGAALHALGIPIGDVFTSRRNRAAETGRLISGKDVTSNEALNDSSAGSASAMAGSSSTGNQRYAAALRQLVATPPLPRTNTLIVTHKTNIQDAFGRTLADIKEGESVLIKPGASGSPAIVARIRASDWITLAQGR